MNTQPNEQAIANAIAAGVAKALSDLGLDKDVPAAPKAERTYRSDAQKAKGHAAYTALWASLKKANPGVSNQDLAKAHRTELNACWPKGSRKTKAS